MPEIQNEATGVETASAYLRRKINESGKSISKVARESETSPVVLNSVLVERRKMGVDLAIRVAEALDIDLIDFLVGMQILPSAATKGDSALKFVLLGIFDELPPAQQRQLIKIAKAIADPEEAGEVDA
jgi:plasmid maintenance system antidote protein VapI